MQETSTNDIKKIFTKLGIGYTIFLIAYVGLATFVSRAPFFAGLNESANSWVTYLLHMIPLWAIAFPIGLILILKLPKQVPEQHEMNVTDLLKFYVSLTFIMIVLNLVGNGLSFLIGALAGKKLSNSTIEMILGQEFLPTFVFAVLFGPIMEELAFRKVLLDRTAQYSKRYSIILSGVMFGLIHLNLYQFFYAAAIGCVFAYIYIKTGKVRYTIILHSVVNFVHGALPIALLKKLDLDSISNLTEGYDPTNPETIEKVLKIYSNPAFVAYMFYAMIILVIVIFGIVMIITERKKLHIDDTMSPLQKPEGAKTVFLNAGILLYIICTIAVGIFEIILQLKA
ncbi:MAG: CPBP family intramembrane metalloprotease [Eubacterium sp.]|nr:CPBP family intramembrane metalloprotease [Eubacterium sp.]